MVIDEQAVYVINICQLNRSHLLQKSNIILNKHMVSNINKNVIYTLFM